MSVNDGKLSSRVRAWFGRLGRAQKILAASATLIITVGGVASGITAMLDLGGRISAGGSVSSDTRAPALPVAEGVRVAEVIPGSPADRAGLEVGDIITNAGGESVEEVDDLQKVLGKADNGEAVRMSVAKDSGKRSVLVKPGPIQGTRQRVGFEGQNQFPDDVAYCKRIGIGVRDQEPGGKGTDPGGSGRLGDGSTARSGPPADEVSPPARVPADESTTYPADDGPSAGQYSAEASSVP